MADKKQGRPKPPLFCSAHNKSIESDPIDTTVLGKYRLSKTQGSQHSDCRSARTDGGYRMTYLLFSVGLWWATWIIYIAVMSLRTLRDNGTFYELNWSVRWLAYVTLYVGLVLDALLNVLVLSVLFLELPKEILSTARVRRWKKSGYGYRKNLACWLCKQWLTPFDARHCG